MGYVVLMRHVLDLRWSELWPVYGRGLAAAATTASLIFGARVVAYARRCTALRRPCGGAGCGCGEPRHPVSYTGAEPCPSRHTCPPLTCGVRASKPGRAGRPGSPRVALLLTQRGEWVDGSPPSAGAGGHAWGSSATPSCPARRVHGCAAVAMPWTMFARGFRNTVQQRFVVARRFCFYPQLPKSRSVLYRICVLLNARLTDDPSRLSDVVLKWHDATVAPSDPVLEELCARRHVVNGGCEDIRKSTLNAAFHRAFGYPLGVDALVHSGPMVEKSESNAVHDGRVVDGPLPERRPGSTYQVLVDNSDDAGITTDIRVPVVGGTIPFAYLRYRPLARRFRSGNERVSVREAAEVMDHAEIERLLRLAALLGLDYGEFDLVRDRWTGLLYAVDANTTPFGPPSNIDPENGRGALERLARRFAEAHLGSHDLARRRT